MLGIDAFERNREVDQEQIKVVNSPQLELVFRKFLDLPVTSQMTSIKH